MSKSHPKGLSNTKAIAVKKYSKIIIEKPKTIQYETGQEVKWSVCSSKI